MSRYVVQMCFLDDSLDRSTETVWYTLTNKSRRTLRAAKKMWWSVVSNNKNRTLYRLFDTKRNEVVE